MEIYFKNASGDKIILINLVKRKKDKNIRIKVAMKAWLYWRWDWGFFIIVVIDEKEKEGYLSKITKNINKFKIKINK